MEGRRRGVDGGGWASPPLFWFLVSHFAKEHSPISFGQTQEPSKQGADYSNGRIIITWYYYITKPKVGVTGDCEVRTKR
jgi:hypothetical protein